MLAPSREGWRAHLGEILDPPLIKELKMIKTNKMIESSARSNTLIFVWKQKMCWMKYVPNYSQLSAKIFILGEMGNASLLFKFF